jgi:hypothetical protein
LFVEKDYESDDGDVVYYNGKPVSSLPLNKRKAAAPDDDADADAKESSN